MLTPWIKLLATGLYAGKSPKAPGTVGTLVAIPLVLILGQFSQVSYMIFATVFLLSAIYVAHLYEQLMGLHDSQEIVIDEMVGYVITMLWLPLTWQSVALGFVLFRLLDILKPFPIGYVDRKIGGGLGVVCDDALAGVIANIVLQIIYKKTMWLGVTWVAL